MSGGSRRSHANQVTVVPSVIGRLSNDAHDMVLDAGLLPFCLPERPTCGCPVTRVVGQRPEPQKPVLRGNRVCFWLGPDVRDPWDGEPCGRVL
ncbi:beta-lactam-binding protein with PASTA domain [Pseudonocardia parietis]|uniref:Beta-lactam-binding protein with PASTA domain n=1 Tax=Pseudonocardia parietis TaxID=570936 RepID=A0ABS4W6F9_9PSEU|nr:beta-lactam-binding protein with PASTA domain [Pseudonocardia parietis]